MEKFDRVVLLEILKNSKPISVVQLCQTDSKFFSLCKDDNNTVFYMLMKEHYPQFPVGKNPKRQYYEITGQVGVEYTMIVKDKEFSLGKILFNEPNHYDMGVVKIHEEFPKYAYSRLSPEKLAELTKEKSYVTNFTVLGTEILPKVVLLIEVKHGFANAVPDFTIKAYKNIADAAYDFMEEYFKIESDDEYENSDSDSDNDEENMKLSSSAYNKLLKDIIRNRFYSLSRNHGPAFHYVLFWDINLK